MPAHGILEAASPDDSRFAAGGVWNTMSAAAVEPLVERLEATIAGGSGPLTIDASGIEVMDVAGAWLLHRLVAAGEAAGREVSLSELTEAHRVLLDEVADHARPVPPPPPHASYPVRLLAGLGNAVIDIWKDTVGLTEMFGLTAIGLVKVLIRPSRIRPIAILHHMEYTGVRAIPIIALICTVIGAIIAQQGAFQLRKFGAEMFSVNLVAILTLREVGVLITSIMVAGRSGSAFTAEIGSMKMREEIDAMRVLGLNPIDVLVVPRVIALMIVLPILTLLADFAGLFGAGLVSWAYIGMTPDAYIAYLRDVAGENTFWVGIIKAPFMAMIIALIACREGMAVGGSAESLGRRTTTAVVKSIFVVIVLDGLFAMFFSAIEY